MTQFTKMDTQFLQKVPLCKARDDWVFLSAPPISYPRQWASAPAALRRRDGGGSVPGQPWNSVSGMTGKSLGFRGTWWATFLPY